MPRYLVRFGYDGVGFAGWARQPGRRTVESEVRDGLVRLHLHPNGEDPGLEVASRTDAGVSARGNALSLVAALPAESLLRALNGISPQIFFTHARPVPPEFRVRGAQSRWYRYYVPGNPQRRRAWSSRVQLFPGMIDARTFGRGLPGSVPALRPVTSVTMSGDSNGMWVDIRAPSFVWGMVRKIVATLEGLETERFTIDDVRRAITGERRLAVPLASPEPLVLWDVEYGLPWTAHIRRLHRRQIHHLTESRLAAETRRRILAELGQ